MKRICAILTAAVLTLCLTLSAGAGDQPPMMPEGGFGPPPDGPGGPGGAGSAGQEFSTFSEIQSHAGLLIGVGPADSDQEVLTPPEGSDFRGTITRGEGIDSPRTAGGLSGIQLEGETGDNGVVIDLESEEETLVLGGRDDLFTVDGEGYNTVISVDGGQANNDAGYEAIHGVGVAVNAGTLFIENSYIRSEGPRTVPVYMFSTQSPAATSLVVRDSRLEAHSDEIWMPPFKLLAGGARATLLMTRNNSWFYNSQVVSNNWGAISQDSVDAMTYVVNSTGMSTQGGYGTYLTYGMRLYGSALYGGQYGAFLCGESDLAADRGSAALDDPDAMRHAGDFSPEDRTSVIAAPCNAIVIHNSLPNLDMVAHGYFRDTLVSTSPEDLPETVTPLAADDPFFLPGVDILGSGAGCGASYFYLKNLYGSLALIRSMNADLTFDGAETKAENGVLLQSVVTYDPPAASGYLTPEWGSSVPGITAAFLHGDYLGDILHQDYQRPMHITVGEGGTVTGRMISGTWAAWNGLWEEEAMTKVLSEDGHSPEEFGNPQWAADVQANLIRPEDTVYDGTDNLGISLDLSEGGTWVVTEDSSLRRLVLAEGAELRPAPGWDMTVYTDCGISNSLTFYDEAAGTALEDLTPGTYENVVIRLTEAPEAPAPEEGASPEPSQAPAEETPAPAEETPAPASQAPQAPSSTETASFLETTPEPVAAGSHSVPWVPILSAAAAVILAGGILFVILRRKR